MKDFSRSQAVMCTWKVIISRKWCYRDVVTTGPNRKWYSYMGYLIAAIVITLSVLVFLKGHSPIASLFKCDILYLWRVAGFLCMCRSSLFRFVQWCTDMMINLPKKLSLLSACPTLWRRNGWHRPRYERKNWRHCYLIYTRNSWANPILWCRDGMIPSFSPRSRTTC